MFPKATRKSPLYPPGALVAASAELRLLARKTAPLSRHGAEWAWLERSLLRLLALLLLIGELRVEDFLCVRSARERSVRRANGGEGRGLKVFFLLAVTSARGIVGNVVSELQIGPLTWEEGVLAVPDGNCSSLLSNVSLALRCDCFTLMIDVGLSFALLLHHYSSIGDFFVVSGGVCA